MYPFRLANLVSVVRDEIPVRAAAWDLVLAGIHHHLHAALRQQGQITQVKALPVTSSPIISSHIAVTLRWHLANLSG